MARASAATLPPAFMSSPIRRRFARASTPYLRWHLALMQQRIKIHGNDPIKAFETGLFSRAILDRLGDTLRTRSPDEALSHIGTKSLDAIVRLVRQSAAAANPSAWCRTTR